MTEVPEKLQRHMEVAQRRQREREGYQTQQAAASATASPTNQSQPNPVKAADRDLNATEPSKPETSQHEVTVIDLAGAIKGKQNLVMKAVKSEPEIIQPRTLDEYIADFKLHCRKTALATLQMARVVHEARESLPWETFEKFGEQIGLNASSATIAKLCCIGRVYERLHPHVDKLPANWTSLYLITQIPAEYFERAIRQNRSFEELTGAQIKDLIQQARDLPALSIKLPKDKDKNPVVAKLVFTKSKIDDIDLYAIKKAVREIEARLPLKVAFSKQVEELWDKRKLVRYEATKRKQTDIELKPDLWDFGQEANSMTKRPAADETK
jgi:hypothetical protein